MWMGRFAIYLISGVGCKLPKLEFQETELRRGIGAGRESGMFWVIVTNELKFLLFMLSLFVVGFHFLHLPKINILLSAFRKGPNDQDQDRQGR